MRPWVRRPRLLQNPLHQAYKWHSQSAKTFILKNSMSRETYFKQITWCQTIISEHPSTNPFSSHCGLPTVQFSQWNFYWLYVFLCISDCIHMIRTTRYNIPRSTICFTMIVVWGSDWNILFNKLDNLLLLIWRCQILTQILNCFCCLSQKFFINMLQKTSSQTSVHNIEFNAM